MKKTKTEQSPQSVGQNLSDTILLNMGIEKDNYPADACFGEAENFPLIGTYSKDRQTVCIMMADNSWTIQQVIPFEVVKEIAYTVKTLITDFGCAVHSYTMKNNKPFNSLKIVKPEQREQVGHTPGENKLTLFVTGTGYREELGKNNLLLRTDDHTIHLHKDAHHLLAHTLVDRYNNYQALVDALNACLNCLTMDSDMEEDFAPEIRQAKKALKHTGKW